MPLQYHDITIPILSYSFGSVFIRDCTNCRCLIVCQQFRMRDCRKLEIFLHCQSQPVTENATAIKFGCFQGGYDGLVGQFEATKLSPFTNRWAQVHDFTPVPDTDNWTLLPSEVGPVHCMYVGCGISCEGADSRTLTAYTYFFLFSFSYLLQLMKALLVLNCFQS